MKICGLDFTSAPGNRKSITCAVCWFEDNTLQVRDFLRFPDFVQFEAFLAQGENWIAGFDFPFGQPAKLINNLGWGSRWVDYINIVSDMSIETFAQTIRTYRSTREKGDKNHLRKADKYADARSPMMLSFVPVGRMFFQGAPRLLKSGASILPCHPTENTGTGNSRIFLEAYPALVARKWIGREGYKHDNKHKQTDTHRAARQKIVDGIRGACHDYYGFDLDLSDQLASGFVSDASGDSLDAVLCAIQAAWAYTQRDHGYGIPADCDPLEGWIVDPAMLSAHLSNGST